MKQAIKRWGRRLALILSLPAFLVVFFIGYVVIKVATYEQLDDAARMQ